MNIFKVRVLLWPILVIIALFIAGMVAATAFGALNTLALGSLFNTSSSEKNSQVVKSIERSEEVVLLKLGIEGIKDKKDASRIGDFEIPWSKRAVFLRYSFDAKLGIDGRAVTIKEQGEGAWRISIPAFKFIGVDDERAEVAVETADGFSWATPKIDAQKLRNSILDDEAKAKHISDNEEILRDQAKSFYSHIIHAVDSDAKLTFEFSEPDAAGQK